MSKMCKLWGSTNIWGFVSQKDLNETVRAKNTQFCI